MKRKKLVKRLISLMLVTVLCLLCLPTDAFAWKILSHVNSADLILLELQRSARQNGGRAEVTVSAPYGSGTDYSYEIPLEYQEAILGYPDAFRAGSLSADIYPDLMTGQGFIHPYDSDYDVGSGEWITLLCDSVNMLPRNSAGRKRALAFTLGFMLHYCGDMFGHDFINSFAGGTYPFLDEVDYLNGEDQNLNIILSHSSEETYMDSLVNKDFYKNNGYLDIAAPLQFVTDTMVFDGNVNNGAAKIFNKYHSLPVIYEYLIDLRMKLYNKAEEWRPNCEVAHTTAVKYLDAWIEDLDDATYALVVCFDDIGRRMITEEDPSTITVVREELTEWADRYGKYITPAPDVVIDGIVDMTEIKKALDEVLSAIGLSELVDDLNAWLEEQIKNIALSALGLTGLDAAIEDYKTRMKDPSIQLDHPENPYDPREGNNYSEFKKYMDRYAEEQDGLSGHSLESILNGEDGGALDNALDSDLEAFYNTMAMFKLILMGPDNFTDFISRLSGVTQNQYQKNTAHLVATSLDVTVTTSNAADSGTDSNIYVLVTDLNGNRIKKKLLDKSNYDDFENGKTDTYNVELGKAVRLDQINVKIVKESTSTSAPDWNCENISIEPYHVGISIFPAIGLGGKFEMKDGTTWDLDFHNELIMRTGQTEWDATKAFLTIKTSSDDYSGTDADIYLDVYNGSSYVSSVLLDINGIWYNDFECGDRDNYTVSLANGSNKGVPLNNINLKLRHHGSGLDAWTPEYAVVTLYHGEIQLTDPIFIRGVGDVENSSWDLNITDKISSNMHSYTPVSLSYITDVDDGLARYILSLDDSRQFKDGTGFLWNDEIVRSKVFFNVFKGFGPDIQMGDKITITKNDRFDMDISFEGVWNGVPRSRRDKVLNSPAMPAVNGTAQVSFINKNGVEVSSLQAFVSNGIVEIRDYSDAKLVSGIYDITVKYFGDTDDQQYADTVRTFEKALTVYSLGDVSLDHKVDNRDLILVARYLVHLIDFNDKQKILADFNEDGIINNSDLVLITRSIVNDLNF